MELYFFCVLEEPLHPLNGHNFMLHPGYVASLSSCVLYTTYVGGVARSGEGSVLDELLGVVVGSLLAVEESVHR
jgi:hypothetical protein